MIHHPAGSHDVGAGPGLADRNFAQQGQRLVVEDLVSVDQAAVSVAGILAETEVGDHNDLRGLFYPGCSLLDYASGIVSARPDLVFFGRQTEEDHRRHAQIFQDLRLFGQALQAVPLLTGHGFDLHRFFQPLIHE